MMVVDTSALMAILLGEPTAVSLKAALVAEDALLLSAGTMAEALIVAGRRELRAEMDRLIQGLGFDIVSVSASTATQVALAYAQWGKGVHPEGLNFGDCFAYALAKERGCRLLFVGDDFCRTDVLATCL
jgi:ribonuclease VapC